MKRKPRCGHRILNHECIECAEVYHLWNSRLQDVGFEDIELESGPNHVQLLDKDQVSDEQRATIEYYDRLVAAFNSEQFEDDTHKFIMGRVCEGDKKCAIVRALHERGQRIHRETVRYVIRRYEHKWGIRTWDQNLMTSWVRKQKWDRKTRTK